jgi:hypothetical protein
MTVIGCPMCPWRAGVLGGPAAEEYVKNLHIDAHCAQFALELGMNA